MADKPDTKRAQEPVHIPEGDYARLIGARAEMEHWANKGNTVARGWVVPPEPCPPVVRLNPPEVEYKGKVFSVEPDQAIAFQAMVEHHPERVGLTGIIGPHPERKMERLPAELLAIVDTTGKGSRLKL